MSRMRNKKDNTNEIEHILKVYEIANVTQQYEGDGIWNRFNVIMSINIILLGILALVYNKENQSNVMPIIITLIGIFISIWGFKSMYRLWVWHNHWKNTISSIENKFPDYIPRLFSDRPTQLKKKNSKFKVLFFSSTQPFMITMIIMWIIIFIFVLTGNFVSIESQDVFNIL